MKQLPPEYPIDTKLLIEAEVEPTGADIHDIRSYLGMYKTFVSFYNDHNTPQRWKEIVKCERLLRGVIAEAKAKRNRGFPIK